MRRLTTILAATTLLAGGAVLTPVQASETDENVANSYQFNDRIGDVDGPNPRARLAADIQKITYDAPDTPAGEMTIAVKFVKLWNGHRDGAPKQRFMTYFQRPGDVPREYLVTGTNRTKDVEIYDLNQERFMRITPETASLKRTFKRGGSFTATFSTEWLRMKQANITTVAKSGWSTDDARRLRLNVSGDYDESPGTGPTPPARR